jgi:hypothetical protein
MSLLRTMTVYLLAGAVRLPLIRVPGILVPGILVLAILVPLSSDAQHNLPDVVKPSPSINLGSTSFYDGFGRLKPGFTLLEYLRFSHNTEIGDADGNENPNFVSPRINSLPLLTQLIVTSKWRPFGGAAGFSVLVPLVDVRTSFADNSPRRLLVNQFGLGDIVAGPTYQSKSFFHKSTSVIPASLSAGSAGRPPAAKADPKPLFAYRIQALVQIPSGEFHPWVNINPGSGYWAVVPYVAATWLPWRKVEMSTRLHYQYNLPTTRIGNPPPIPHLVYVNGQAGQLVYGNFTASYRATRKLYLGANSYGVYQLSPDRTNGVTVIKARETQFYLGPGGGYDFNRRNTLNVNVYLKIESHNTASGPAIQMLYIHRF